MAGHFFQDTTNASLGHTASYTYDTLNRLATSVATGSDTHNLTFSYDRHGNMTCVVNGNTHGPCPSYSFSASTNRISNANYTYDAAGDLTQNGTGHGDAHVPMGRGRPDDLRGRQFVLDLDGHEQVVRNAEISGLTAAAFKEIAGASRDQTVYSAPFMPAGALTRMVSGGGQAESGLAILSFMVPSFLFEDLTLKKPTGEIPKPPVVKHPYFDE